MPDLTLSTAEARRLDAEAMKRLQLPGLLLMEHAAMGVVRIARAEASSHGCRRFVVLAGRGGNGGDGWAAARLLHLAGLTVSVHHLGLPAEGSDAHINLRTARAMGIPNRPLDPAELEFDAETLVVDAMFGIGLRGPLEGPSAGIARKLADSSARVVAVDVPSGLDAETGASPGEVVRADVTATMIAPKRGMLVVDASSSVGRIETVDIGIPRDFILELLGLAETLPVGDTVDQD